jgi:hypothetical protein
MTYSKRTKEESRMQRQFQWKGSWPLRITSIGSHTLKLWIAKKGIAAEMFGHLGILEYCDVDMITYENDG